MLINKAYRFRFYPTVKQIEQLSIDFGCARFVYNTSLDAIGFCYRSLDRSISSIDCSRAITELKKDFDYAWLKDANSTVLTQSLRDLDTAFKNFFAGRASYPSFKKKSHSQSVRYQLDQRNISRTFNAEQNILKLPKLGALKLRWSQQVEGIPRMVTVTRDVVGDYFVSFACEVEINPLPKTNESIGIDVGLTDIATLSNGWKSGNPKYIRKYQRKLKLAQRTLSRRKKGSKRWHTARRRVAKIQRKIANCRKDFLHKLSTMLIQKYDVIALEDLNIKGLMRALRLSKSVADAALGELVREIEYKANWYGRQVIKIDRFTRSTGVCPDCGTVGKKLPLHIRSWRCECGTEHDRDIAAAQVILNTALGRSVDARGAGHQPMVTAA